MLKKSPEDTSWRHRSFAYSSVHPDHPDQEVNIADYNVFVKERIHIWSRDQERNDVFLAILKKKKRTHKEPIQKEAVLVDELGNRHEGNGYERNESRLLQ